MNGAHQAPLKGAAFAAVATVVAFVKLRERKDLVVGTAAFTVILLVEAYLGGEIGDSPAYDDAPTGAVGGVVRRQSCGAVCPL